MDFDVTGVLTLDDGIYDVVPDSHSGAHGSLLDELADLAMQYHGRAVRLRVAVEVLK